MTPHDETLNKTDPLSALGRQLLNLDRETSYAKLVVDSPGNRTARDMLQNITTRDLIDGPIGSPADAQALLAGLWLRHDWLNESHEISQKIQTPTGSLWHAIMHRREGDFSNSKYWYARCEDHPAYPMLAVRVGDVINPYPADKSIFRLTASGWNPNALVDLVKQVHDHPGDPRHGLAVAIQEIEWQVIFDYCTRMARGG